MIIGIENQIYENSGRIKSDDLILIIKKPPNDLSDQYDENIKINRVGHLKAMGY